MVEDSESGVILGREGKGRKKGGSSFSRTSTAGSKSFYF